MCGICGKITLGPNGIDEKVVRRMTQSLRHRGPDDEGIYLPESKNQKSKIKIALGHRRLSIIDLSTAAHQPMANEDGTVWIVYNGEIYNFKDLRKQLQKKGHIFKSQSDTEVIVHLYEEAGLDCVKQLRGMFAFAIWDQRKERLFLARDRLGQKPLNYTIKDGQLIFASEIKAILEDPEIKREVNIGALHNYLSYQYVPAPETMFAEIKKLPPAHILVWEKGKIKIERYWDLSFANKLKMQESGYCERLLGLFTEAAKLRLMSDVPLGVFLSGGIDSSAVVAVISKFLNKTVKTFSIGFRESSFNELKYARIIARVFNTEHTEYIVEPRALEILPGLIEHFGEPFADSSAIATYYLSKLTRSKVTVALNGDAGDESFAGYERYAANKLAGYYGRIPAFLRNRLISPFFNRLPESTDQKDLAGRIKRFINPNSLSREKRYAYWVSTFDNKLKERLYSSELKYRFKDVDSGDYLLDAYNKSDARDFIDSTLFVDSMTYLPNDLLVKVDITSMANSLEGRSPFLDHKLMEFAAQIPSGLKLKGLTTKYILKKALRNLLPREILRRGKAGFGVPLGKWFRGEMKDYAYETLLDERSVKRGYFRKEAVQDLLDEHTSGKINHGQCIWSLIVLELWHHRFIDSSHEKD